MCLLLTFGVVIFSSAQSCSEIFNSAVTNAINERDVDYDRFSYGKWFRSLCFREANARFNASLDTASEAYFTCIEQ
ncbi:MAG: hypothetical protein HRU40_14660 [Saprospiraceae bacterium]|nr:hypothetical protein [Saprospiraceae bacterium]